MARNVFWAQVSQKYLQASDSKVMIFYNFMILLDSYYDSAENEVLFVKIRARVPDLWLDIFFGPLLSQSSL